MSGENNTNLFKQFPPVTRDQWEKQAVRDLKGSDLKKLIWKPYEGFEVNPFYLREDLELLEYSPDSLPGKYPFTRGRNREDNRWEVCERITGADINEANKVALNALDKGADSLSFSCVIKSGSITGVPVQSTGDMTELLKGIQLDKVPVSFEPGIAGPETLSNFITAAENAGFSRKDLRGKLFYDPLSILALVGSLPFTFSEILESIRTLLEFTDKEMKGYLPFCISGSEFHESGASHSQEIAFTIAKGVDYIVRLNELGLDVDSITRNLFFRFPTGSDYFMEIAKLRAARTIWSSVIKQFDPADEMSCEMNIHVDTELWNKTIYDPYVNMIRATVESMAAAIGGCDSISVTPMNVTYEPTGEFSRRMARNTQLVIKEEAYMNRVIDPAAGSYYIENLTQLLIESSFDLFLKTEEKGGYFKALSAGFVQKEISEVEKRKIEDLKKRKMILVGTNQYPAAEEEMLKYVLHKEPEQPLRISDKNAVTVKTLKIEELISQFKENGRTTGDMLVARMYGDNIGVQTIRTSRGAELFEELRFDTEKYMGGYESNRPGVFLLKFGNLGMRNARASFSRNFFGCAGFGIIEDTGYNDPEEAVAAAAESSADIVVLCSSDSEYEDLASVVCPGVKDKRPRVQIVVAGYPKDKIESLREKGIDEFIFAGSNAFEILKKFQKILGIIPG